MSRVSEYTVISEYTQYYVIFTIWYLQYMPNMYSAVVGGCIFPAIEFLFDFFVLPVTYKFWIQLHSLVLQVDIVFIFIAVWALLLSLIMYYLYGVSKHGIHAFMPRRRRCRRITTRSFGTYRDELPQRYKSVLRLSFSRPNQLRVEHALKRAHTANTAIAHSTASKLPLGAFLVDSGANVHICSQKSFFRSLTPCSVNISTPGTGVFAGQIGTVAMLVEGRDVVVPNVLYVPHSVNLLSLSGAEDLGWHVDFRARTITLPDTKSSLSVRKENGLYVFSGEASPTNPDVPEHVPQARAHSATLRNLRRGLYPSTPSAHARLGLDFDTVEPLPFGSLPREHAHRPQQRGRDSANMRPEELLHLRLGHPSGVTLKRLVQHLGNDFKYGVKFSKPPLEESLDSALIRHCASCAAGKAHRHVPSKVYTGEVTKPGDLIYTDIWGPANLLAFGGNMYCISFLDAFSRFQKVYLMSSKDEALSKFKMYHKFCQHHGVCIQNVQSDNDKVYHDSAFTDYLAASNVQPWYTAPYAHEQAGVIERNWRTLFDRVRAMLAGAGLGNEYWGFAVCHACYLLNRTPHSGVGFQLPYELWYGNKPRLDHLRVWGAKTDVLVELEQRVDKVDARSRRGILVGFDDSGSAEVFFETDLDNNNVFTTAQYYCHEEYDLDGKLIHASPSPAQVDFQSDPLRFHVLDKKVVPLADVKRFVELRSYTNDEDEEIGVIQCKLNKDRELRWVPVEAIVRGGGMKKLVRWLHHNPAEVEKFFPLFKDVVVKVPTGSGRSPTSKGLIVSTDYLAESASRRTQGPHNLYYKVGFEAGDMSDISPDLIVPSSRFEDPRALRAVAFSAHRWAVGDISWPRAMSAATSSTSSPSTSPSPSHSIPPSPSTSTSSPCVRARSVRVPRTYKEALTLPEADQWRAAVESELGSHMSNGTFEVTVHPAHTRLMKSKFIFKIKADKDGYVSRFKARLVCCGYSQKEGVDYDETFAPVSGLPILRLILALAVKLKYSTFHFDFTTAFLNAEIDKDCLYMALPEGLKQTNDKGERISWHVLRAIYGTKQAPRLWNILVSDELIKFGFSQCTSDRCLFYYTGSDGVMIISLYVDDLQGICSCTKLRERLFKYLSERYDINDLGPLSHALGMSFGYDEDSVVKISQKQFVEDMAADVADELSNIKPKSLPITHDFKVSDSAAPGAEYSDFEREQRQPKYASLVGKLRWLCRCSRPDIGFALSVLSRFQTTFHARHYEALLCLVKYVEGTKELELVIRGWDGDIQNSLHGFADADFANDSSTEGKMRSTTGGALCLGPNLFDWISRRQSLTAVSTSEAEYIATFEVARDLLVYYDVLSFLGWECPPSVYNDGKTAVSIATTLENTKLSKYIDVKFHRLREWYATQRLYLAHLPGVVNIADVFTKALPHATSATLILPFFSTQATPLTKHR
ncbi:MAG: hypothetical protein CML60_10615 [Rhodobacteraceae bacterium]|nr:hypothetical protein [Paracoccaceae bacterium]